MNLSTDYGTSNEKVIECLARRRGRGGEKGERGGGKKGSLRSGVKGREGRLQLWRGKRAGQFRAEKVKRMIL